MEILTYPFGLLQANMYVIRFGNEAVLVDPCVSLNEIDLGEIHVSSILCTHGHFDHISDEIAGRYSCPVYISKEDAPLLNRAELNLSMDMGMALSMQTSPRLFDKEEYTSEELGITGDKCFSMRVISTPGHTSGSVCFLFSFEGESPASYMFTGDTLFAGSIGRTDLGGNMAEMEASLTYLKTLPDDIVCLPGHGPRTVLGTEKQYNPYLNERW